MCDHVWIFEARTLSTASPATMRDVRCRDRMEPSCREPGIQTQGRARSGETLRACPRVSRAWGRARNLPGQPSQIGGSRIERGQSATCQCFSIPPGREQGAGLAPCRCAVSGGQSPARLSLPNTGRNPPPPFHPVPRKNDLRGADLLPSAHHSRNRIDGEAAISGAIAEGQITPTGGAALHLEESRLVFESPISINCRIASERDGLEGWAADH
jgi:hypothetical protein